MLAGALSVYSLATAYVLVQRGPTDALFVAALPLLVLVAPALLTREARLVFFLAAVALPFTGLAFTVEPLPTPGPAIYPQDLIVVLALGSALFAWLAARHESERFVVPRAAALGWPFVVFACAIVIATMRGHYDYGATLFGQPLRLALYAGIVAALAGITARELYRALTVVLYAETVVTIVLLVPYYIATGSSQTDQLNLSTGGSRVLGISTSLYCAAALFLALLNIRNAGSAARRAGHVVVAGLALVGVAVGFGRAVYVAVVLVVLVMLVTSRSIRSSVASMLPLALPFVLLVALFLPKLAPATVEAAKQRVSAPPATDANVQWRLKAGAAVSEQIREQPLFGVGFGRTSEFFLDIETSPGGLTVPVLQKGGQDPHNGYLFLWAGGGLLALGSFLLILLRFGTDVVRRLRRRVDPTGRVLLVWAAATAFAFLLNAATGTSFSSPSDLLAIWAVLVVPAVVARDTHVDGPR